jgi:hypothetical protein
MRVLRLHCYCSAIISMGFVDMKIRVGLKRVVMTYIITAIAASFIAESIVAKVVIK